MSKTIISNGPISSLSTVKNIGHQIGSRAINQFERDAAAFALHSPHAVLAQPETQRRLLDVWQSQNKRFRDTLSPAALAAVTKSIN